MANCFNDCNRWSIYCFPAEAAYNSWNDYDDFADYDEDEPPSGEGLAIGGGVIDYNAHQAVVIGMGLEHTQAAALYAMNQQKQQQQQRIDPNTGMSNTAVSNTAVSNIKYSYVKYRYLI